MKDLAMEKCMKTSKKVLEVSGVEDPRQKSSLFGGVLTRARTVALKKLGLIPADSPAPVDGGSYIQLRSRRLQRFVVGKKQKKRRAPTKRRAEAEVVGGGSGGVGSGQLGGEIQDEPLGTQDSVIAVVVEGNGREESEGTPCSLPRGNVIRTLGRTTRARNSTEDNGIVLDPLPYPTEHDIDAFFAKAEELQRKRFIEKYNFDPLNEQPLPGRYEWVKVDP